MPSFAMMGARQNLVDDIETYGRAVDAGDMTLQAAISALVEARQGVLAPLGAADLLANWKTAHIEYEEEVASEVLPDDPDEYLAFVKQYGDRSRSRIADLHFAVENNIIPTRFQGWPAGGDLGR
ncbi:hypothetical protein AB0C81_28830 [Streptomyces roseoverticillatus]|uniref:hypothetical protein n=1 Tax=Streptomyces roseoverticillatus TaxID=66429 RepID=UPI00340E000B